MNKVILILLFACCVQNMIFADTNKQKFNMDKFETHEDLNSKDWQVPVTMHESERICSLINQLKERLANGNPSALEEFWSVVEKQGTPLLEPIPGNDFEMLTTFIWRSHQDHKNVVVASYGIASFDPFKNMMTHIANTDVWYKSWILPRNARTIYCISPDDPLISISDYRLDRCSFPSFTETWTNDPLNKQSYFIPGCLCAGEKDQLMSLLEMPDAPKMPWLNENAKYPKGSVSTLKVQGNKLDMEREIYLYLPPNYDPNHSIPYPLVVAFDGYACKDFMNSPAIFDYLIANGKIPPSIVVMILNPAPNTVTRLRDLACHEPFFSYVANELIPWVRENYRVTSDPHQTVVTGASLGGVASVYMGLIHSEIFGNILAQSGAYWWLIQGEQDWLIHQYVESSKRDLRFFLDAGSLETVPTFANGLSILYANRYLRDVLRAKGYPVKYVEFSGGHDYICWQETFAMGLEHLLGGKD